MHRLQFTRSLALALALGAGLLEASAGVSLSSYTFTVDNLPYIWTDDPLPEPYRLRAKIAGNFHATSLFNNDWTQLESVPGPGTFMAELYYVLYDSDGSTLVEIGPFTTKTIIVQSATNQPPRAEWVSAPATSPGQWSTMSGAASDPNGNLQYLHFFSNDPNWSGYVYIGSAYVGSVASAQPSIHWLVPPASAAGSYQAHLRASDTSGAYDWNGGASASFAVRYAQPAVSAQNATVALGAPFSPLCSGGAGTGPWQYVIVNKTNWGGAQSGTLLPPYNTPSLIWTADQIGAFAFYVIRQGDGSYVASNIAGPYILTVKGLPPTLVSQPVSQVATIGKTVTFSVTGTGGSPFTYQWRKNGALLAGATNSSYIILSAQTMDAASAPGYSVVVSNSVGSVTSQAATLAVTATAPIRLALQYWEADDWPNCEVQRYGDPEWVLYRWVVDEYDEYGNALNGYEVWDPHWEDRWVTEIAPDGQFGSRWDTTVGTFGHPLSTTTGAFSPAVTNRGYLLNTYSLNALLTIRAWAYAPAANCSNFTLAVHYPLSGQILSTSITAGSYREQNFLLWQNGIYRIDLSYSGATAASQPNGTVSYYVAVGIGAPPVISVQPGAASQTVAAGASVSYAVEATDATTYQWHKDGAPIPGATAANLTLANLQPSASGTYGVVVGNAAGTTASNRVVLVVLNDPLADSDGDGLPNGIEQLLATNPNAAGTTDTTNTTLQLKIHQP
jgi:hypothetical protein